MLSVHFLDAGPTAPGRPSSTVALSGGSDVVDRPSLSDDKDGKAEAGGGGGDGELELLTLRLTSTGDEEAIVFGSASSVFSLGKLKRKTGKKLSKFLQQQLSRMDYGHED